MSQPPIERPWDPKPPAARKQVSAGTVVGILAAVLGGLILVGWIGSALSGDSAPKAPPAASNGDRYGAFVVCQDNISSQLKAPSTAEFASITDSTVSGGASGVWNVRSYVDAQNGFGAMIRSEWTCTATHSGSGYYRTTATLLG